MQPSGKKLKKQENLKQRKVTKRWGLVLFLLMGGPTLLSTHTHEYYVSVTTVEYAEKHKAIQIISQIFIDDFEKLIRERYDPNITLAVEDESEMAVEYMKRYLKSKLELTINDQSMDFIFLGKRYDEDIVYCYLEIEGVESVESITIVNDILYDLYEEQENIVRTKINSKSKSFILTRSRNTAVLNFN